MVMRDCRLDADNWIVALVAKYVDGWLRRVLVALWSSVVVDLAMMIVNSLCHYWNLLDLDRA